MVSTYAIVCAASKAWVSSISHDDGTPSRVSFAHRHQSTRAILGPPIGITAAPARLESLARC